jgi:uncharacterized protein YjbJ (UPF0337 family)
VIVVTVIPQGRADVLPSSFAFQLGSEVNMSDNRDLASEGAKDRLKGAAKQLEGRVRNAVGGATGDTGEQLKGKAQEIKGKAQGTVGKAKQKLDPNPGVDDE